MITNLLGVNDEDEVIVRNAIEEKVVHLPFHIINPICPPAYLSISKDLGGEGGRAGP